MGRHGTLFLKKTTSGHPGTGWTTMGHLQPFRKSCLLPKASLGILNALTTVKNHDLMQKKTGALYALRSFYDCETQD
jgi:hypothetical protein